MESIPTAYSPFGATYTGGVPPTSYWYNTYPQQLGGFLQGVQGVQGYTYAGQAFAGYQQQYMGKEYNQWANANACSSMGGVQLPWALGAGVGGVGSVGGVAAMSQPPQIGEDEWLAPSLLV
ncbi:hypothetical protein HF086_017288 [Spodoptera exigua]|uniref:Uncharacterized protein n=1 Tax=Spodoptera exigua TaxID=7107 RepID=A0A922M0C3_SPOEX|nr:hypothetical protein HF086_017288 [Spodoptera exigua]